MSIINNKCVGLDAMNYTKFLSARWAQLTNTRDYAYL